MEMSPVIAVHMTAALGALATGPVALWARRAGAQHRPRLHRAFGYAWVTLMLVTAISALFIRDFSLPNLAGYTPIHVLVPVTLVSLFGAFWKLAARQHRRPPRGDARPLHRRLPGGRCFHPAAAALPGPPGLGRRRPGLIPFPTHPDKEHTMSKTLSDQDIERIARRSARARLGWYIHGSVYLAVMTLLAVLSALGGKTWAVYPAMGWGLGLAIHGLVVFFLTDGRGAYERLVDRERERLRCSATRGRGCEWPRCPSRPPTVPCRCSRAFASSRARRPGTCCRPGRSAWPSRCCSSPSRRTGLRAFAGVFAVHRHHHLGGDRPGPAFLSLLARDRLARRCCRDRRWSPWASRPATWSAARWATC